MTKKQILKELFKIEKSLEEICYALSKINPDHNISVPVFTLGKLIDEISEDCGKWGEADETCDFIIPGKPGK